MVNIQAITVVSDTQTNVFDSYDAYYNHIMASATSSWKQKMIKVKALAVQAEREFSELYGVPIMDIQNVCFVFGTTANARRHLRDLHTRELVLNPEHRIVVNMRRSQGRCAVTTIIYRPFDHQIIESSFVFQPDRTRDQEP
jgi:hypothetical protein